MRTDDLIRALAADHTTRAISLQRYFAIILAIGFVFAAALFAVELGPRADIAAVAAAPRFLFKFAVTLLLAGGAAALLLRLARPGAATGIWKYALLAAPTLLIAGVFAELVSIPASSWLTKLVGTNALFCLVQVPLLSAPLLVAALIALRHGAPTRPALAGAVAGILAGGLGAALYAAHCTDDSPLFVATWYSIAIAAVGLAGSYAGARLLRW